MTTAARPPGEATPWLILGGLAAALVPPAASWAGGALAATITSRPVTKLSGSYVSAFYHGRAAQQWPGISPALLWAFTGVTAAVVLAVLLVVAVKVSRRPRAGDPRRSLAAAREMYAFTEAGLRARVQSLRPGFSGKPKSWPVSELGVPLGELSRMPLRASWEDVILAIMAPRAGKTTALAVPALLDAPGAAIATSNKADLWVTTATARAERGTVWTFDPQGIAHAPRAWWWNPLAAIDSMGAADRLARHFLAVVRDSKEHGADFWSAAALDLLSALILAAGGGRGDLRDVYRWLTDSSTRQPVQLLEKAGHQLAAGSLSGIQGGALETREGIWQTARTAAQCLRDSRITEWVTPSTDVDLPAFDPEAFVASSDTLFLMSKDGAGGAAPLVAALTDAVFRAAIGAAEQSGGRLDPPLVAVLDEAANICRISDLPELYSHLGSRGLIPITILQSYRQGVRVWGDAGMDTLWSAATVKLIGPGIDDAKIAEDISRLVGEHEVPTTSFSRGGSGSTTSTSTRRERILDAGKVRALPRGHALLLATGTRVAMVRLRAWFDSPRADTLTSQKMEREKDVRRRVAPADLSAPPPLPAERTAS